MIRERKQGFEAIVVAHHPETPAELFPEAIEVGQQVLDGGTTTVTRADYHRAMLRVLGIDAPSAALLRELEAPAAGPVVEVFPDVRRVLDQLRAAGVRMYAADSELLGLDPGDCLFVDDDPQLVSAAIQLGYHGAALTLTLRGHARDLRDCRGQQVKLDPGGDHE